MSEVRHMSAITNNNVSSTNPGKLPSQVQGVEERTEHVWFAIRVTVGDGHCEAGSPGAPAWVETTCDNDLIRGATLTGCRFTREVLLKICKAAAKVAKGGGFIEYGFGQYTERGARNSQFVMRSLDTPARGSPTREGFWPELAEDALATWDIVPRADDKRTPEQRVDAWIALWKKHDPEAWPN